MGWFEGEQVTVIAYKGEPILRINRTRKGLAVEAKLYEPDGRPSAVIVDNRVYLNPTNSFSIVRDSDHSLAILNQDGKGIFGLIYLNASSVAIRGNFNLPDGSSVLITDTTIMALPWRGQIRKGCLINGDVLLDFPGRGSANR